jgi:RNA polymerase sigma factor FliA
MSRNAQGSTIGTPARTGGKVVAKQEIEVDAKGELTAPRNFSRATSAGSRSGRARAADKVQEATASRGQGAIASSDLTSAAAPAEAPRAASKNASKAGGTTVTKRARATAQAAPAGKAKTSSSSATTSGVSSGAPRPAKPVVVRAVAKSTSSAAAATRAAKAPPKQLTLAERPIDQVWREYRATPTTEVRNFLIARHLDLVAYAAERLHKRLPSEVEINDLKSAGAFGLMDAVDSFDPDRGVKFETFCTQRIRGAMFDELRSMDWVPRLVRSRTAKVEKVRKSIEMETGSKPTEDEVAERLNVSNDEFEKLQKDSRPVSMVSLTRKCFETDSSKDVREIDVVEDGRQESPLQAVQKQDLQTLITKGLSRAERLIVILYYYEEMTMKEIGATLDLSESRVSQMHSSILARLKAQMQHREATADE